MRTPSAKAKPRNSLKELIAATTKLWRKHHLTYDQARYLSKEVRNALGIERVKTRKRVVQRLSRDEEQRLIQQAYKERGERGLLIKTLFQTGARVSEFVNIKVEDFFFDETMILIAKAKGSKSRYVPILPELAQELRYVFCDLFREVNVNTTIRALIAAMRTYRTIPQALVFDNGPYFKGKLIKQFCRRLGIRLIHSSVNHPQTNGKLERAFRDDMNEFYRQRKKWIFNELRRELPAYVKYRNQVRGHYALQGKPSSTRLQEQNFFALPFVLGRLESYAWCERGQKTVGEHGRVRLFGRAVYIDPRLNGQKIQLYETLEGMEAKDAEGKFYLLKNYRKELCRPLWSVEDKTRPYYFTRIYNSRCAELPGVVSKTEVAVKDVEDCLSAAQESPRVAVAYSQ